LQGSPKFTQILIFGLKICHLATLALTTCVVALGEGDPSGQVDPAGDGGGDRVRESAADQEEEELRVVLQRVLVRALEAGSEKLGQKNLGKLDKRWIVCE
jgi:hypothetical protein